jgi:hypothetical protein
VECDVVKNYGFVVSSSYIKIVICHLKCGVQYSDMWATSFKSVIPMLPNIQGNILRSCLSNFPHLQLSIPWTTHFPVEQFHSAFQHIMALYF